VSEQQQGVPEFVRGPRKADQIADWYTTQITLGHIRPGDRLPTVLQMAQTWHVSAGVTAVVIAVLKERGLVTTHGAYGTRAV